MRNWARADAGFGAALAAARRQGTWRRLWAFDAAKAAAFLARAWAGERVNALIGQPGMPSRCVYTHWNATHAPFAEAVAALRRRRDAQLGERGRARRRAFDPALADRIIARLNEGTPEEVRLEDVLLADPALPCWETMMRWRREERAFDQALRMTISARRAAVLPVPEPLVDEVVDHIAEGGSFLSFSRLPGGPSQGTLRRWMRDPKFADAVARACVWREAWYQEQIDHIALTMPPGPVREMDRAIGPLRRRLAMPVPRPNAPGRADPSPADADPRSPLDGDPPLDP